MSDLRDYLSERADIIDVFAVRNDDGGVDYMIKIDGTYWLGGADENDGMLEYHRRLLRDVLKSEGIVLGERYS